MTRIPPILVVTVVGAIAALSVMKVRFSSELYALLPRDLPEVRGMEQINRFFARHGQLVVTVKGEAPWAVEEASESLAAHLLKLDTAVAEVNRELSLEQLVTEGGDLLAWTWLNAPPEALAEMRDRLSPPQSRIAIENALAAVADSLSAEDALIKSYDPLGLSQLDEGAARADPMRSPSGLFEVLYVEGRGVDFSDYRAAKNWLEQLRQGVADWQSGWRAHPSPEAAVVIGLTGTPAFMAEVGSEMERDMTVSVVATLALISLLFFLMHRQLRPLSWLLAMMLAVLAVTLNLGALLYGDLSVMSAGFAAILMGLAVDYGIVLYRHAINSEESARGLRRAVGPGIVWAAATTALVFLSLNLSSLPGLAEMGNLVTIGILVGALIMLFLFAPVAAEFGRLRCATPPERAADTRAPSRVALLAALVLPTVAGAVVLLGERPNLEANFHPFRMRESPSMKAWQELQTALRGHQPAVPTIVTAENLTALRENLAALETRLASAQEAGLIEKSLLPTSWIPSPVNQQANATVLRLLLAERPRLLAELDRAGFSEAGTALTAAVFDSWERYLETVSTESLALPSSGLARWSIDRIFREQGDTVAALATMTPVAPRNREWVTAVCDEHTNVAGLQSLGTALNERIRGDLSRVFLPMAGLLTIMLAIVFRSWRDLGLSLLCFVFAGAGLVILTALSFLGWNSFNVCGLPLIFGTGLDYSIHMIFALRRAGGDVGAARRGMGKALTFCGLSSAIGFGSLATASAHGLSSLGIVCAAGILMNMLVAVVLLPHWYRWIHRRPKSSAGNLVLSD